MTYDLQDKFGWVGAFYSSHNITNIFLTVYEIKETVSPSVYCGPLEDQNIYLDATYARAASL